MIHLLHKLQVIYIILLTMIAIVSLKFYTSNRMPVPLTSNIDNLEKIEIEYKDIIQSKPNIVKPPDNKYPTVKDLLGSHNSSNFPHDVEDESAYLKICPNFGNNIKIVFIVTSKPDNEATRRNVRRTWGSLSMRKDLSLAFIMGFPNNKEISKNLKKEQQQYGDLIRGKFLDTYDNLTLKTTWMLWWVSKYCKKAEYVLKVDDDIFVNVDVLLEFINGKRITSNRAIYGRLVTGWHPVRDPKDKYFISKYQYEGEEYPAFTTGGGYIFPTRLAIELYNEALKLPYIKLEDVFYNGIVASRLNISRIGIDEFVNNWVEFEDCTLKAAITIHGAEGELLFYVWYRVNAVTNLECD